VSWGTFDNELGTDDYADYLATLRNVVKIPQRLRAKSHQMRAKKKGRMPTEFVHVANPLYDYLSSYLCLFDYIK
jgi:hypothetical protein